MNIKDKIEITRNILNNAAKMNASEEVILKISKIFDKYVIEFFRMGNMPKK